MGYEDAVDGCLASGESIQATYNASAESHGPAYILTDRRLLKIRKDGSGRQASVSVIADPLRSMGSVKLTRVEGEELEPRRALAAVLCLGATLLTFLPTIQEQLGEARLFIAAAGLIMAVSFAADAISEAEDGYMSVKISLPSNTRYMKLPHEAESFGRSIVSTAGEYSD